MADRVLYFPYIRVPENAWFTRVLLYWDQVGSIVPEEYLYRPESLGTYMRELVEVELVRQVLPSRYVYDIPRFTEAFIELIDHSQVIGERSHLPLEHQETLRINIHIRKLGYRLTQELCDRGLARRLDDGHWYEVERVTANLFMAYLASVLGRVGELQMDPITDQASSLSVFSNSPGDALTPTALVDQLRMAIIEGVLPAPAGGVSVRELARFRERHIDLLSRFRRRVESELIDISLLTDAKARSNKVRLLREDWADDISEIRARMQASGWRTVNLGTVCGLVAAAIPGFGAIAADQMASSVTALPGLIAAIYSVFSERPDQREILRSPLAYAALAQERLT